MPSSTGTSIPDTKAVPPGGPTIEEVRTKYNVVKENQIQLTKVSHMRYQHPDLEKIKEFLLDFGMQVAQEQDDKIWFKGYGPDNYVYYAQQGPKKFLGGAFEVQSMEELKKATRIERASGISKLEGPGGGYIVTMYDPAGFPINLIWGQDQVSAPENATDKLIINYETDKPRSRKFQRFEPGPAAVYKLGHFGLNVCDFESQFQFYIQSFNLFPSDFLYVDTPEGEKRAVAVFAHIDRGQDLVDHHTFFMSTGGSDHVHHCSFEVHDYDTQHLGHQWLAKKGYKSVWGVGRHILGSQVFDYWWDTTGNMVEHYADGDLVNEDTPIGLNAAGSESLAVWGPEVPASFLE